MSQTPETTTTPAAEPIPTDLDGLVELLRPMARGQQHTVADDLAAQLGGGDAATQRAYDLVTDAIDRLDREREIARHRIALDASLAAASAAVECALAALGVLTGAPVFDVEYAEGQPAIDMRVLTMDAGRALRAAAAINPCPQTDGGQQ